MVLAEVPNMVLEIKAAWKTLIMQAKEQVKQLELPNLNNRMLHKTECGDLNQTDEAQPFWT